MFSKHFSEGLNVQLPMGMHAGLLSDHVIYQIPMKSLKINIIEVSQEGME